MLFSSFTKFVILFSVIGTLFTTTSCKDISDNPRTSSNPSTPSNSDSSTNPSNSSIPGISIESRFLDPSPKTKQIAYLANTDSGDVASCIVDKNNNFTNCKVLNNDGKFKINLKHFFRGVQSIATKNNFMYVSTGNDKSDRFYIFKIEANSENLFFVKNIPSYKNLNSLTIHNQDIYAIKDGKDILLLDTNINQKALSKKSKLTFDQKYISGLELYNHLYDSIYFHKNRIFLTNRKKGADSIISCKFDESKTTASECSNFLKFNDNLDKIIIHNNFLYTFDSNKNYVFKINNISNIANNTIYSPYLQNTDINYNPNYLAFFNKKAYILNGINHVKKCSINPDNGSLNSCEEIHFIGTKLENKIFNIIVFATVNTSL